MCIRDRSYFYVSLNEVLNSFLNQRCRSRVRSIFRTSAISLLEQNVFFVDRLSTNQQNERRLEPGQKRMMSGPTAQNQDSEYNKRLFC